MLISNNVINRNDISQAEIFNQVAEIVETIQQSQIAKCNILKQSVITEADKTLLNVHTDLINGAIRRSKNARVYHKVKKILDRKVSKVINQWGL